MNRTRGIFGSLAMAVLLGVTLAGGTNSSVLAQDMAGDAAAAAESQGMTSNQTEADAIAAAFATGKYPFGTKLMLLEGRLGVRNAAGSEAAVLTEIDEGAFVTVEAGPEPVGGTDWYKIETEGGVSGWIDGSLFGIAQGAPALEPGTEREVITTSLNLRAEPGTDGEIVSGVAQDDIVTIVSGPEAAGDLDWYQIETEFGELGWLAAVYLDTPGGDESLAAGAQTSTAENVDFPEKSWVFVNSDTLNLRADASIEAEIVAELVDGQAGMVTGAPVDADDYTWYPVSFGSGDAAQIGWVAGSLLSGGIAVGSNATVADGPLNVRADATVDSDVVTQLESGASVAIISGPIEIEGVSWFEVQSTKDSGYVAGRYLGA